ncbi:MAG: class I SAM-dependent methyltransferase [Rhodomicrobium sp.]
MTTPRLNIKEAIAEVLEPSGKTVVDIGCGDGAIVRHLRRGGAKTIGIEVTEEQLERARAQASGGEAYCVATGEALPLANASADALLYLKSFHHLPLPAMAPALEEAARVLKAGGVLAVIEPIASGAYFEAMRPIEDETAVRAAAYAVLKAPPRGLLSEGELFYESIVRFRSAEDFIRAVISVDPIRRQRLPQVESELLQGYETYCERDKDGEFFITPMRRNVFRKAG